MFRNVLFNLLIFVTLFCCGQLNAQSANWTPIGASSFPTNYSGQVNGISRITQLKIHPVHPDTMYAVSARGGLFITRNAGLSWTVASGTDLMPATRLSSVCIDHNNDQIIYLGTGDANYYFNGKGVYKSTNGGTTFAPTSLTSKLVVEILMDPLDHNAIFAATNTGIYKSTNGGSTWVLKSPSVAFYDLKFKHTSNARTIYAASISGFYRSSDFGETWSLISNGIYVPSGYSNGGGCRIATTPQDTNLIYVAMVAKNGTLFKSVNGGTSFAVVKDSLMPNLTGYENSISSIGQGDYNFAIRIDPSDANTVFIASQNLWKSNNGGVTFTQLTQWVEKVPSDMHQIIVNPQNGAEIWNCNDGGVWLSVDSGINWTPKSNGIYGYEVYHSNSSAMRKDLISMGTQDNGELYANSNKWYCNRGGDWMSKVAFDFTPGSSTAYYYANAKRRDVLSGNEYSFNFPFGSLQDICFYKGNYDLAFAGNNNVYRTVNLTSSNPVWTQITSFNKPIMKVYLSVADSNRLYVITNDQTLYVSNNALATTPTFIQYTLPYSTSSGASIVAIKNTPDILYAVFNTRVYRSINNGLSWTNISVNLPAVNYVNIISDEYSSNELVFVAGNNSVYYKKSTQTNWVLFSNNLPTRTTISDFSIYNDGTNNSVLRVSEYGRGVWESPFGNLQPLKAFFGSDITNPCQGGNIQFSDYSTGSPLSWSWSFQGGTPTSSTLKNPVVLYNSSGNFNVTLIVSNGITTDTLIKNNYITTIAQALPLIEGFESISFTPINWKNIDGGNDSKIWQRTTSASGYGVGVACVCFSNYTTSNVGQHDELRTPVLDFYPYSDAWLYFDVAYHPYSLTEYLDTLEVIVSTDCGASFTPVYTKYGSELSSVSGIDTTAFVPSAMQWRKDSVDLSSFTGSNEVMIGFRNIGNYGNNIYLDNINVAGFVNAVNLFLSVRIQGLYSSGAMEPLLMNQEVGDDPTIVDTITVELHESVAPYSKVYSANGLLHTDGTATIQFPVAAINSSYYIAVKHRSSLETWSKSPVEFNTYNIFYSF